MLIFVTISVEGSTLHASRFSSSLKRRSVVLDIVLLDVQRSVGFG